MPHTILLSLISEFYDSSSFLSTQLLSLAPPVRFRVQVYSSRRIRPFYQTTHSVAGRESTLGLMQPRTNADSPRNVQRESKDILNPSRDAQSVGVYPRRDQTIP